MNKIIATLYVLFLFSISIIIFLSTNSILIKCLIILNSLVSILMYCLNIFSFKSRINYLTHYIFNTFDKTATQSNKEYEETIDSKLLHQINKYKQELDIEKEETIHSKQEIQSLVTHISHQVKTPLANIKIYNDLLARNDLSKEEAIDFHIMLNQQINKLDFLMESLIKMSRLETDIIQLNIEKNDLYSTLIEVINHVFLLAEKKHINIELSKNTHISALYDEKWTQEAIFNVLEKYVNKRKRIQKKYSLIFIVLILCLLAGMIPQKKDTLKIATKPMTEQYILGEMLTLYIEQETNLQVEVTQGVGGGTSNIEPALEKGEFDMYPEYTGTGWNMVLKNEGNYDESMFKKLQKGYQRKGLEWQGMYGFNNTYGLAVRKEIADQYQLKTYSDLKNISNQLIFGAEYDFFEREDGYDALCKTYNLNFKETMDMDIGLKYQALNQGKVDVMTIFTTDGPLSNDQIVVLEDDQHFYPSYMCGNVVRSDVLKKHPELKKVLKKLSYKINDLQMAKMNDFVESKGKEPKEVAKSYLKKLKLLKE